MQQVHAAEHAIAVDVEMVTNRFMALKCGGLSGADALCILTMRNR